VFIIGLALAIALLIFTYDFLAQLYCVYFFVIFLVSSFQNKSIKIGYLSVTAVWKQFSGYGLGFLESYIKVIILKKKPEEAFPQLFFKV
jgi:hypothetical protein